jgi:hypothetical protein
LEWNPLEMKVMPGKLQCSQCIQLFSYIEWNPLLYMSDEAESHEIRVE